MAVASPLESNFASQDSGVTGYEDLNMSTSLPRIRGFAAAAGFHVDRVVLIWHFRLARLFGVPMGYFISFKTANA